MEDNIKVKTTFDGKQPLMDDNIWEKIKFNGRQPWITFLMERKLRWGIGFNWRPTLIDLY